MCETNERIKGEEECITWATIHRWYFPQPTGHSLVVRHLTVFPFNRKSLFIISDQQQPPRRDESSAKKDVLCCSLNKFRHFSHMKQQSREMNNLYINMYTRWDMCVEEERMCVGTESEESLIHSPSHPPTPLDSTPSPSRHFNCVVFPPLFRYE